MNSLFLRAKDSHPMLGHLVHEGLRNSQVVRDQLRWVARQPFRQGNLLVHRAVEKDDQLRRLVPQLLNVMTEALFHESNLARTKLIHDMSAMRPEEADATASGSDIKPLIRVGMPVEFSQRSNL